MLSVAIKKILRTSLSIALVLSLVLSTSLIASGVAEAKMTVKSSGIKNGVIADKFGEKGSQKKDIDGFGVPTRSLPLTIKGVPKKAKYFAIYMYDPDGGNWIHWMAVNYKKAKSITENASVKKAKKMVQGKNDFGTIGYGGPTPGATHKYVIKVYALKKKANLSNGFTLQEFNKAIKGKVLKTATIKGTYTP